jgi:sialic acid synthase SpsE/mannose-6-phosphate isomerase-like protein (cupin superfamily)
MENMEPEFDFRDLFVLDLANNHQGSVEHGKKIIQAASAVCSKHGARAAIKFQFRQLDTFIHPDHQQGSDFEYIQRFLSTRMKRSDFQALLDEVWSRGQLAACTPFDEESLGIIDEFGFDIVKVASCSARDWPLLEAIADCGKPVICSTGGLVIEDIDNVVSFFQHRAVNFALMHCVSIYPTPDERLSLYQIRAMRERYPGVVIGWSTHESPDDTVPVGLALALGAEMFERHVGMATDEIQLNAYSSTPEQLNAWLVAHARAKIMLGPVKRPPVSAAEQAAIDGLRRGVYAKRPIRKGTEIARDQVFFAMPYHEGQLESGSWKRGITANTDIPQNGLLALDQIEIPGEPDVQVIKSAVHEVKAMLNEARICLGPDFAVEYSHHYGVSNFRSFGAVLIECINRDYCKKLVIQLPHQRHPAHYHARKEETFQVLYGVLYADIDGHVRELRPGDTALVQPGVWHSFWTEDTGVIFEEVSTRHYDGASFYKDKQINKLKPSERKTTVDNWGRFQLPKQEPTGGRAGARDPGLR